VNVLRNAFVAKEQTVTSKTYVSFVFLINEDQKKLISFVLRGKKKCFILN